MQRLSEAQWRLFLQEVRKFVRGLWLGIALALGSVLCAAFGLLLLILTAAMWLAETTGWSFSALLLSVALTNLAISLCSFFWFIPRLLRGPWFGQSRTELQRTLAMVFPVEVPDSELDQPMH